MGTKAGNGGTVIPRPDVIPWARAERMGGVDATNLSVLDLGPTSVTFGFASLTAPHPLFGPMRPSVPTLGEVAMTPADDPRIADDPLGPLAIAGPGGTWLRQGMPELPVVARSDSDTGVHVVTVTGLEPGREYVFECRCNGAAATPGDPADYDPHSPEVTGRITTPLT